MAELDDVGEATRLYQHELEAERRVFHSGVVSDLEEVSEAVAEARADLKRRWDNASFWRMVDGFAP